ncbi:MAG: hypothetical protein H7Y38_11690 [Armatimonadetes bacterium]|nr:hypothetical protein [Armatimonadota bacterium]
MRERTGHNPRIRNMRPHRFALLTTEKRADTSASAVLPGMSGVVRLGKRTKELAPTLAPGAIVVIHHADLDTVAARTLLAARPLAVINNAPFVSGRYPNRGPAVLLDAGIALYERADGTDNLFDLLRENEPATLSGDVLRQGSFHAPLSALSQDELSARLGEARANVNVALSDFAQNTLRYLDREDERALLLDPVAVPETRTVIAGRAVLIVVRGDGYEEDLAQLGLFLREQSPAVIAVDGAADALLSRGVRPDIVLGDMDSISDAALKCGAELIVHAYAKPKQSETVDAPGLARVHSLGLKAQTFPVAGTSEDAALLLAYERGADLIVAVGTHSHLEDFLDKGRGGMASTFLVRLKVGSRLVDARGVSRLYARRQRLAPLMGTLAVCAAFPMVVLLANTAVGQHIWRSLMVWLQLLRG